MFATIPVASMIGMGIAVIFFLVASAHESAVIAAIVTGVVILASQLLSTADPLGFANEHARELLFGLLAYIPLGVGWSMFRWWKVLKRWSKEIVAVKDEWKPGWQNNTWDEYLSLRIPKPSDNKDRIVFWIAYWPLSVFAFIAFDFLADCGRWLYERISGIYQAMADRVLEGLKK